MSELIVRITGVHELDDSLSYLRDKSAKRIGKSCVGTMATVTAKAIRAYVPASIARSVNMASDKGIGSRTSRAKMSTIQAAKAGVSVGAAYKNSQRFSVSNRGGRPGVGISARNEHWFALGTADRWTGSKRNRSKYGPRRILTGSRAHFTGRIDKAKFGGFVPRGAAAAKMPAIEAARQKMDSMIAKEAAMARSAT